MILAKKWCEEKNAMNKGLYVFVEHNVSYDERASQRFEGEPSKFKIKFVPLDDGETEAKDPQQKTTFKEFKIDVSKL